MIRRLFARWKSRRELAAIAKQFEAENDTLRAQLATTRQNLEALGAAARAAAVGDEVEIQFIRKVCSS
jgi:hypothetical protein